MHNGIYRVLLEQGIQQAGIGDIAFEKRPSPEQAWMTVGQVVYNDRLMASFNQMLHHVGADVTGTARDQNF